MLILILMLLNGALSHMALTKPKAVGGCYKGEEGAFFWTVRGDELTLEITGHITTSQWIGIGFSSDVKMGGDDVVAVVHSNEKFQALALFNSHAHTTTSVNPANSSIISSSVRYNGGEVRAKIVKQISGSFPLDLRKPTYLFFAKGPINSVNQLTPLHRHTKNPTVSRTMVDLHISMPACISVKTNIFLKLHGMLMVMVWLNLTIMSMFIARYAKYYFKQHSMWYTLHRNIGIFSGVLVLVALILAVAGVGGDFELEKHQVFGVTIVTLLVLHVWLALFKPAKEHPYRKVWEYIHKITAVSLHCFSFYNILSGLRMLKVHSVCFIVVTVQVVCFCLLFIVMESPQHLRSCSSFINRHFNTTLYFRVDTNVRYKVNENEEEEESEYDDIVTLDQSTATDYTHWAMYSLMGLNSISVVVLAAAIMIT